LQVAEVAIGNKNPGPPSTTSYSHREPPSSVKRSSALALSSPFKVTLNETVAEVVPPSNATALVAGPAQSAPT
jgi:hypothetical protein